MIVIYIAPIFIIFLSNVVIIWRLAIKRVQSIGTGRVRRGDHAFSKTITVLVAVSLVYFLTMSPMWVYILLHDRGVDWQTAPPVELERFRLGWAVVSNISLLNSGTNFFIYCLTHPQFVVEVKLCFGVFASRYRSHCQICKRSNTVGVSIIHVNVKELNMGVAGPSGIQAQLPASNIWIGFRPKGGSMSEEITIDDVVWDKLYFQLIDQTSWIQPNKSLDGRFFPH